MQKIKKRKYLAYLPKTIFSVHAIFIKKRLLNKLPSTTNVPKNFPVCSIRMKTNCLDQLPLKRKKEINSLFLFQQRPEEKIVLPSKLNVSIN